MKTKTKYWLYYLLYVIFLPSCIWSLASIFLPKIMPENSRILLYSSYSIISWQLLAGFILNYWYASKLGVKKDIKILISILTGIGFLYLMGYDVVLISALDIIKKSWELFAKNWRKLLVYMALLLLPSVVLSILGVVSLYMSAYVPSSTISTSIIILLVGAASVVFTLWTAIAFAKVLYNCLKNQTTGEWKSVYSSSSGLIWPVIYTSFLVSLIVMGGTLLFIIPGIIFMIWYSFSFYTVVFEGKTWMQALTASKSLVAGRWWPILWRLLLPGFVFGLLAGLAATLCSYLIELIPLSAMTNAIVERVVSSVINIIITPVTAAASLILYVSAKENPVSMPAPQTPEPPKMP
jgi:hypothetical protein